MTQFLHLGALRFFAVRLDKSLGDFSSAFVAGPVGLWLCVVATGSPALRKMLRVL
jgi:hypothetical protein